MSLDPTPVSAEKTVPKQRGRPFARGKSGNPTGRPKGARNRVTAAVEALLDVEAENITRMAISKAMEGDLTAVRLCLDRIAPPRKDRPVSFALPKIETAEDSLKASSAILAACADGTLSPGEAEVMALISAHVRTLEVTELDRRIAALEQRGACA
jgi:Family of unknown function (DUF5681)